MKEFKQNIVNALIDKAQGERIVSLKEVAAECGVNHLKTQEALEVVNAALKSVPGYHLVRVMMHECDSIFQSVCLVEDGFKFAEDFEIVKYWLVDERIDAELEDSFPTEEEAVRAAEAAWSYLTDNDRKLRRQFCVVSAPEDEDGGIDWNRSAMIREWIRNGEQL